MRAALPGTSGTSTIVILASLRSCATPAMIGCSIGAPSTSSVASVTRVPVWAENDERTCTGTAYRRAYSTQRSISTFAPLAAISSISSNETWAILRASGTIRGSAVKTPSTSV
jgi:hypothetical protein